MLSGTLKSIFLFVCVLWTKYFLTVESVLVYRHSPVVDTELCQQHFLGWIPELFNLNILIVNPYNTPIFCVSSLCSLLYYRLVFSLFKRKFGDHLFLRFSFVFRLNKCLLLGLLLQTLSNLFECWF